MALDTNTETLEIALRVLALESDNTIRAAATLKAAGHDLTSKDLEALRASNPDRYAAIREEVAHTIGPRIAQRAEDIAAYALDTMWMAVDETRKKLVHGSLRDPSTAAKNLASTADLAAKQAALIRGQPTQIVQDRSAEELLRSLAGKLPGIKAYDADTDAEEEPHQPIQLPER